MTGATPAYAQATRTWVSGVGDDANPCSRTAPCKTFAGAISKTAAGGEIDVLDPGGFGAVTITKSITIDGTNGAGFGSILVVGTAGIIVNANAASDVVTIRNLSIQGVSAANSGTIGINILSAKDVIVENVNVSGFHQGGSGRGISDTRAAGGSLLVTNSTFTDNNQAGIVIASSATGTPPKITAMIEDVDIQDSQFGLSLAFGCTATISRSTISGSLANGIGIAVQSNGTEVNVNDTVISGNTTGIGMLNGATTVRLANNMIVNNGAGVTVTSGTVQSWGNNRISGNGSGNTLPAGSVIGQQ
jgi:hypothetical protein